MNHWQEISNIKVKNPEQFKGPFKEILKKCKENEFNLNPRVEERENYVLVVEEDRLNSLFIHIIPKEVYDLFKQISIKAPQEFLGFSILAGEHNNKEIRISCFGIPCPMLQEFLSQ